ncbi:hypothetical protein EDD18DRAFT_157055 [Armillaria luteobubalina]|uniref:Secreted protein n=1 Tax=Armillaria luteobubalina TaxID=153913 RepID=A0AA39Q822_9AGAR|nr:hypothetical protein EDD18DRAFT_157055 [Armillaria luteobubalina]
MTIVLLISSSSSLILSRLNSQQSSMWSATKGHNVDQKIMRFVPPRAAGSGMADSGQTMSLFRAFPSPKQIRYRRISLCLSPWRKEVSRLAPAIWHLHNDTVLKYSSSLPFTIPPLIKTTSLLPSIMLPIFIVS